MHLCPVYAVNCLSQFGNRLGQVGVGKIPQSVFKAVDGCLKSLRHAFGIADNALPGSINRHQVLQLFKSFFGAFSLPQRLLVSNGNRVDGTAGEFVKYCAQLGRIAFGTDDNILNNIGNRAEIAAAVLDGDADGTQFFDYAVVGEVSDQRFKSGCRLLGRTGAFAAQLHHRAHFDGGFFSRTPHGGISGNDAFALSCQVAQLESTHFALIGQRVNGFQHFLRIADIKLFKYIGKQRADVVAAGSGCRKNHGDIFQVFFGNRHIAGFGRDLFNRRKHFRRIDIDFAVLGNLENFVIELLHLFFRAVGNNAQTFQPGFHTAGRAQRRGSGGTGQHTGVFVAERIQPVGKGFDAAAQKRHLGAAVG